LTAIFVGIDDGAGGASDLDIDDFDGFDGSGDESGTAVTDYAGTDTPSDPRALLG
jgi:hypothetical protein